MCGNGSHVKHCISSNKHTSDKSIVHCNPVHYALNISRFKDSFSSIVVVVVVVSTSASCSEKYSKR